MVIDPIKCAFCSAVFDSAKDFRQHMDRLHSGLPDSVIDHEVETVDHPAHYGGADNVYEAIKVIEAWGLGFCLGNTLKYIARAEKKGAPVEDLEKARWYLDREIARRKGGGR